MNNGGHETGTVEAEENVHDLEDGEGLHALGVHADMGVDCGGAEGGEELEGLDEDAEPEERGEGVVEDQAAGVVRD